MASILSIGILVSLVNYIWGDRIAEWIPGGIERTEQIFLDIVVSVHDCDDDGWNNPVCPSAKTKKEKKYKTVLFTGIMAVIMFATLWQYQNTMQGQRRNMGNLERGTAIC